MGDYTNAELMAAAIACELTDDDFLVQNCCVLVFKGQVTNKHSVERDSAAPNIYI